MRKLRSRQRVGAHARAGKRVGAYRRSYPIRRVAAAGAVSEAERNPGSVSSYHTSSVNAPLGYQGLFRGY